MKIVSIVLAILLAGCAGKPAEPEKKIVMVPVKPYIPAECDERDDPGVVERDRTRDWRVSDSLRQGEANTEALREVKKMRRICGAGIRAGAQAQF